MGEPMLLLMGARGASAWRLSRILQRARVHRHAREEFRRRPDRVLGDLTSYHRASFNTVYSALPSHLRDHSLGSLLALAGQITRPAPSIHISQHAEPDI